MCGLDKFIASVSKIIIVSINKSSIHGTGLLGARTRSGWTVSQLTIREKNTFLAKRSSASATRKPLRIAIDSGGTFTDCIWLQASTLRILKVFSTPADPAEAIAGAVRKIAGDSQDIVVLHGTTVGTNTLLQRKGARVAFVTTAGFEDSIEIGRQHRPKLYDFFFEKDPALAPSELRFGVDERVSAEGTILRAPDKASLELLAERIAAQKPQAIAISLLFSFANPANEKAVAEALARLKLPLSISHQILPEFREYERASTVLVNAYLQPLMQSYLQKLQERTISVEDDRRQDSTDFCNAIQRRHYRAEHGGGAAGTHGALWSSGRYCGCSGSGAAQRI